jgi:hypothetical protein
MQAGSEPAPGNSKPVYEILATSMLQVQSRAAMREVRQEERPIQAQRAGTRDASPWCPATFIVRVV